MTDIRDRVEEDRGPLKTIQTFVPGFRGYRLREDLRDSDRMLRAQLAKRLGLQRRGLEDCRTLIKDLMSPQLEMLGGVISRFKKVEGLLAHAEMGYSGFRADIQVKEPQLNSLYEYDAGMIGLIGTLGQSVDALNRDLKANDFTKVDADLDALRQGIGDFQDQFERRMVVITNTEVTGQ